MGLVVLGWLLALSADGSTLNFLAPRYTDGSTLNWFLPTSRFAPIDNYDLICFAIRQSLRPKNDFAAT